MTIDHAPVSGWIVGAVVIALFVALLFAGCASTAALGQRANGDRWEVRSNRLFWQTEDVTVRTPDGTTVTVSKTGADAAALGTIVGAAIKAAK